MFPGDRVEILPYANYNGRFTGATGVIVYMSDLCADKIGVRIDGEDNPASKYRAFWFEKSQLSTIEREEIPMLENYNVATIHFLKEKYAGPNHFYALYDENIAPGDTVVVKTGHHGFILGEVEKIEPQGAERVTCGREVVARVDFSAYEARAEKAKRKAELRKAMESKVLEIQRYALYDMLAEKDPDLKAMLAEYRELTSDGQEAPTV